MLLAEIVIRHTRRHQPTRRVALGTAYLPTSGPAHGAALAATVFAAHVPGLADEQRELLPLLLREARDGLEIPRIALRHRLQHDVHGLDRSRHRMFGEDGRLAVEIDMHGAPGPQVLGVVCAAAGLPPSARRVVLDRLHDVLEGRWHGLAAGVDLRWRWEREAGAAPPLAGVGAWVPGGPAGEEAWTGVASDQRWAMEVLGLRAGDDLARDEVNRRFRRLLRDAHPDHGAPSAGAAARIAELSEARTILLAVASAVVAAEG